MTQTAEAQLTQTAEAIAGGGPSPTPTATALPSTGVADDAGLPGLAGLAARFLGAIFPSVLGFLILFFLLDVVLKLRVLM